MNVLYNIGVLIALAYIQMPWFFWISAGIVAVIALVIKFEPKKK